LFVCLCGWLVFFVFHWLIGSSVGYIHEWMGVWTSSLHLKM